MKYNQLITELKVYKSNEDDELEGSYVIFSVDDGKVFMTSEYDDEELLEKLNDEYDVTLYDMGDIKETNKLVGGEIEDNMLVIMPQDEDAPNSVLNKQFAKFINQFDLYGIVYRDYIHDEEGDEYDIEQAYSRYEVINASVNSDIFYHGTDYASFRNIIRKGLVGQPKSNYTNIVHYDKVFITSKLSKAATHALNSAEKNNSIPVIIKVKVPDVNKLVLDYDVAIEHYGIDHPITVALGYDEIFHNATNGKVEPKMDTSQKQEWEKLADKSSLNTKAGIFGYAGRIPASHIVGFYLNENIVAEYEIHGDYELPPAQILKDSLGHLHTSYAEFTKEVNDILEREYDEEDEDEDNY